ncbi:MAG: HEPN domain-containing protein [Desulfurococcales archaeon]|nr:HEPN domain-containing protein [Desulfurococcales archaeon]
MTRREAVLWLRAAEEDLLDAEDALRRRRWFRAAFFAHQVVEKALKALYYIVLRREPPRIHTVTELYRELYEGGLRLPPSLEGSLYVMNKYYTVTRYPDAANGLPSESVDEEEARRAVEIARRILEEARKAIYRAP